VGYQLDWVQDLSTGNPVSLRDIADKIQDDPEVDQHRLWGWHLPLWRETLLYFRALLGDVSMEVREHFGTPFVDLSLTGRGVDVAPLLRKLADWSDPA
jgi:hypothetical protein